MLAAITLQLADYGVIGGMLVTGLGVVVTALLANLRAITRRVDRVEDRWGEIERQKADKHEWAREVLLTREKLDALGGQLQRMDGKLDANWGMAACVNRLSETLKELGDNHKGEHISGN